jgi:hypothetical protein
MMPNTGFARIGALVAFVAFVAISGCGTAGAAQSTLPARYADSTFWRLSTELSEPGGYFRSDNLLSNETSFQWVVPTLQAMTRPDGVYLGVAPEQNFTFIAALKPKVAFIIDIRRGNLLAHLMYKALFETTDNRVDFAFRLFGRMRPADVPLTVGVEELFARIGSMPLDTTYARRSLNEIKTHLTKARGFPLSADDLDYIEYIYVTFSGVGPGVRYNMSGPGAGIGGFRGGRSRMPNYADLMTETDSLGVHRSYLATDENFRVIKDMQERNVIIPFTGDFAGPKAIRAFGRYVRDHNAVVQAIYVSNVEQYLFQDPDNWRRYYDNVATLPTDSTSVFIRSASQGYLRQQSQNSQQNELICPVADHMKGFKAGNIRGYWDIFGYCR